MLDGMIPPIKIYKCFKCQYNDSMQWFQMINEYTLDHKKKLHCTENV